MVCAQQPIVCARRFGGFTKVAQQCGGKHVLHQGRFARAAYARNANQPLQGYFKRNVLQVVLACAFKQQARGVGLHSALPPSACLRAVQVNYLLAPA